MAVSGAAMSALKAKTPSSPPPEPQKVRRRPLRRILLALVTQYAIIATIVGLSVAATLHYLVTPQIVAQFEAIEAAFKRLPRHSRPISDRRFTAR